MLASHPVSVSLERSAQTNVSSHGSLRDRQGFVFFPLKLPFRLQKEKELGQLGIKKRGLAAIGQGMVLN